MSRKRLTPETKTLRYMVHGMGMVACRASSRFGKLSFDLYGFVDVVGLKPRNLAGHERQGAGAVRILHVQATSSDNQGKRRRKITESPVLAARAFALVAGGHRVDVWGWVRGRTRETEAFHCYELRRSSPSQLTWHDRGIVEVDPQLLGPLR